MLVDWFTIGAQTLNFIVLVWLMRRFLYRPILAAIDAREERIAAELSSAAAKMTEAERERNDFQAKKEEIDGLRAGLLAKAAEDAGIERRHLLDEARKAADDLAAKRLESLNRTVDNLKQAIGERVQREVFAVARKALADLASTSLEERLVDVFARRIRAIDEQTKARFKGAIGSRPVIRSAFELPAAYQETIKGALKEALSIDVRISFEIAPELICGIELTTDGQKLAWSLADYVTSLERDISEIAAGQTAKESAVTGHTELTRAPSTP